MTFGEEKLGWAFAGAEGLEKRIAICEKLAETEAQREELASMRRRLAAREIGLHKGARHVWTIRRRLR